MKRKDEKPRRETPAGGKQQQQFQGGEGGQYGEGNYKATRQYDEGLKEHLQEHDVEREAREAEPRSASEEQAMEEAERIGRSKSRGEGAAPDGDAADKK